MIDGFQFKYIVGAAQGQIVKRAGELTDLVQDNNIDTLVFVDRSARPASWIFESFWSKRIPEIKSPDFVFINTGKKDLDNLTLDENLKRQIERELGDDARAALSQKTVLMVDDIFHSGKQKEFITAAIKEIYHPKNILYFEWNKLGGMRLPHGLSYEDDGSFIAVVDEAKEEVVRQIKQEIARLALTYGDESTILQK
ncbi:MAG TPA: hypothetical protein VG965_06980 [Patescibacteria group bacterium]|nr:hypothetical protein [Patescibacteria group bacterium]